MKLLNQNATQRLKTLAMLLSAALATTSFAAEHTSTRADALLQIDMSRPAVVERIISAWAQEIPVTQVADLKQKLMGLRADQLLAANLSGSFDGVLEIMQRAHTQSAAPLQSVSGEKAKAIGEPTRDLVYTPVTPCRIIDTRGAGAGILVGGTARNFDAIASSFAGQGGSASACDIDAGAVAIALNMVSTQAPGGGNMRAYSSSLATAPLSSNLNYPGQTIQVSEANLAIVPICTASCPGGLEMTVLASSNSHLVADVFGFFMPPTRTGDGLRVVALPGQTVPNVINGDSTNGLISTAGTMRGATIGGGAGNIVGNTDGDYGWYGTIAGGADNRVGDPNGSSGDFGTVGGGSNNKAYNYATVSGGFSNGATGGYSTIPGGGFNVASGDYSTVAGGNNNGASGAYSFAAGQFANANSNYCVVFSLWPNGTAPGLDCSISGAASMFKVGAQNGLRIDSGARTSNGSGSDFVQIGKFGVSYLISTSTGARLTGAGVWESVSDRAKKENFRVLDAQAVLKKLVSMPVTTWNYIAEGKGVKRIGPMAQDFRAAFGLGHDDKAIGAVDASGVAFAAIQGLNQKLESEKHAGKLKDAKISALEKKAERLETLEREFSALKKKLGL